MSNKFLYEVRPVKPVVTPDGRAKRRPFSSLLSKEEVMEYMKSANIYRRFTDATEPIKVTGETLDSLHREKFTMSIEDVCKDACKAVYKVDEPVMEPVEVPYSLETESVEDIPTISEVEEDEIEEELVEEPEITVNEEEIEEIDASEETVEETDVEATEEEEEESEAIVEETEVEDPKPVVKNNGNKNTIPMNHGYHNKKKHR